MQKNGEPSCAEIVRAHDADRYLLSMLSRADVRADLWALFAFNYEIAKTREVVSDSTLGLIRLQWWRDAIGGIYDGKILSHEVVEPLAQAIRRHDLPREDFETLIYAREFDLEDVLPGNLEGLINYADFTSSPLMRLAVRICGGDPSIEPVQPVAVNYALAGLLRAVPFHARQGRCYLPEDLMARHGLTRDKIGHPAFMLALKAVIRDVCDARVDKALPEAKILRLSDALAGMYLRQLEKQGFDPFCARMQVEPPFKVLRLVAKSIFM